MQGFLKCAVSFFFKNKLRQCFKASIKFQISLNALVLWALTKNSFKKLNKIPAKCWDNTVFLSFLKHEPFPLFVPTRYYVPKHSWLFSVNRSWPFAWAFSTVLWTEKLRNGEERWGRVKKVQERWTVRYVGRSLSKIW